MWVKKWHLVVKGIEKIICITCVPISGGRLPFVFRTMSSWFSTPLAKYVSYAEASRREGPLKHRSSIIMPSFTRSSDRDSCGAEALSRFGSDCRWKIKRCGLTGVPKGNLLVCLLLVHGVCCSALWHRILYSCESISTQWKGFSIEAIDSVALATKHCAAVGSVMIEPAPSNVAFNNIHDFSRKHVTGHT